MADITEVSEFTATVPELPVNVPAAGGPGGIMNSQAQALANRTAYFKAERDKETTPGRALVEAADVAAHDKMLTKLTEDVEKHDIRLNAIEKAAAGADGRARARRGAY